MKNFYTPPVIPIIGDDEPLVFLAGPVQGAPDWQSDFAQRILETSPHAFVASPRRTSENQRTFDADGQVRWEHAHLERARKFGVVAFWWAAQDLDDASYPTGRAYAQTSRIEFGKACGWRQFQPTLPIIVGYDPAYTKNGGGSESYVRKEAVSYSIPVCDSAEDFLHEVTTAATTLASASRD